MPNPRFLLWTLAAVFAVLGTSVVCAQDYPNKPIRIVTVAAGGSGDFASRLIAQEISGPLGQPVIVDNRSNTVLAIEAMIKAPPDGHVLLEGGGSTIWVTPFMRSTGVFWDPIRDFSPITLVERSPGILVVHPSLPVKSVKELIALARARPGELNYSSAPAGGSSHLSAELFKAMGNVNLVWIPYKGAAPAILGLIGGEAHLSFGGGGAVAPHLKSGKLRALAVTGLRSSALVPGLPTVAEAGVPGFEVVAIDVLMAPAKTPAAIVNRLNQEVVRVLNRPDAKERLLNIGVEVATSSPEELTATIKTEMAKWGKLIKDIGLRLE